MVRHDATCVDWCSMVQHVQLVEHVQHVQHLEHLQHVHVHSVHYVQLAEHEELVLHKHPTRTCIAQYKQYGKYIGVRCSVVHYSTSSTHAECTVSTIRTTWTVPEDLLP
jgi:hypothetical protein